MGKIITMFGIKSNKREFTSANAPKPEVISFDLTLKIKTKEGYYEKNLAYVTVGTQLLSNTDTKVKDILREAESKLNAVWEEASAQIENSRLLTDGFWAEEEKNNT